MCNASKHSPGCSCGFGPPYPPRYTVADSRDWAEEAVDDPEQAVRRLRQSGWDHRGTAAFAERRALLEQERVPKSTWPQRFREFLGVRQLVVESSATEIIDVPLYRLSAPPVPGAIVRYGEVESVADTATWKLNFRGVGLGQTRTLELSKSHKFSATNGAMKLLFVPVLVRVEHVAIYDAGELVGRGVQASVVPPAQTDDPLMRRRGVRSLTELFDAGRGEERPQTYHDAILIDSTGEREGDPHQTSRTWTLDVAAEVSLSLQPLADVSALVTVRQVRRCEISAELPVGYNYRGHLGNGCLWWESPEHPGGPQVGRRRRRAA